MKQLKYENMKQFDIYIDGSHLDKQHDGRLGVGGALVDLSGGGTMGKLINKFAIELTPKYMSISFGASKCSNPSAELVALLIALREFKGSFGPNDLVVVHADYLGVREWMTGAWKIKEPYIARIKNDIDEEISKQELRNRIKFQWVRGHQKDNSNPDVYWNNFVDTLAKGEEQNGDSKK